MPDHSPAKVFWEKKILRWETFRYSPWLAAHPLSWTIRARRKRAAKAIVARLDQQASVIELGCGSGYLASMLVGQISSYRGIDIAANAVALARRRVTAPGFEFESLDVSDAFFSESDLTVFLGLIDWLKDRQIEDLFARLRSKHILFSYTAVSRFNPYRLYRHFADHPVADQTDQRARSFTEDEISRLLLPHGYEFQIISSPWALDPGGLVWATKKP
jgi:trans-aconitate methyltransferase